MTRGTSAHPPFPALLYFLTKADSLSFPFIILPSATAEELLKEYKACESPDYITYVRAFVPLSPLPPLSALHGRVDGRELSSSFRCLD